MIDAALIQQCADPGLQPAIVDRFIAEGGSPEPLAITVQSGDRLLLVPQPSTPDEAMAFGRKHIGKAVVRVGVTKGSSNVVLRASSDRSLLQVIREATQRSGIETDAYWATARQFNDLERLNFNKTKISGSPVAVKSE
ncbi:MAG: hypothetical protein EOR36_30615 [Mesorhizobium sp.]|uniref:hypothetical protein n=1 Tax=Mesorhizobium sp. TaxID=1871066 RepID=UPI000FE49AFD|nr:hypothetical protein [Mesorhizobium sp.]RWJ43564.1 MAG: hypothetical protein EOR29_17000 [Mesorhizobium sp.]RWJ79372.1 MAG: hypothetical protein EOR36_30615 [Mesorhizobium sp.]